MYFPEVEVLVPLHEWKYHDSESNLEGKTPKTCFCPVIGLLIPVCNSTPPADPYVPM